MVSGIEDNAIEQIRFRRTLEDMKAAEIKAAESADTPLPPMEEKQQMTNETQSEPSNQKVSTPAETTQQPESGHHNKMDKHSRGDVQRHVLVNNYRPVQPLNGRTVYRSFPFFNQPIEPRPVYMVDVEEKGGKNGVSSVMQISFTILIIAFMAYKYLQ